MLSYLAPYELIIRVPKAAMPHLASLNFCFVAKDFCRKAVLVWMEKTYQLGPPWPT